MGGDNAVRFLCGCPVVVLLLLLSVVNGYPDGAPDTLRVCKEMKPGHAAHSPQTRPAPFTITLNSERYSPGQQEPVRVTIKMNEGTTFKGFLIQARRADSNMDESIGKFKNLPWTKQICAQNSTANRLTHANSLTHADSSQDRTEVTVEWMPPPAQPVPVNVQFRVTVVVDLATYWVDERSNVLYDQRSKLPTTPRPYVADITEGCGRVKGCYRNPPSCTEETCDIVATWRESEDKKYVEFQLSADITDGWVAIGLSDDKKMGSDDVMECIWNKTDKAVNARMSKNTEDKQNRPEASSTDLQRLEWVHTKGRIRCQFIRVKRPGSTLMDKPKHLLLAKGPATEMGLKQRHVLETGKYPYVSVETTTMSEKKDMTDTARYPLVKAHGCLMLIGWMMCASTALILAKYYKRMWPNNKICGAPVWLAVHRALMLTNLVCTCIAFILIFVHVRGYSKMPDYPEKAHPPLGICVTILVILNPIISLFRCKPDTVPPQEPPRCRPVFNWIHWLFGTVAYVLQMPTIFIGLNLHKAFVPSWATWVITAFVLFHLIIELLLEIHGCLNAKKQKRQDDETKPDFKGERGKEEPVALDISKLNTYCRLVYVESARVTWQGYRFKRRILTLYVIVVTVLGIVMVIAVAAG